MSESNHCACSQLPSRRRAALEVQVSIRIACASRRRSLRTSISWVRARAKCCCQSTRATVASCVVHSAFLTNRHCSQVAQAGTAMSHKFQDLQYGAVSYTHLTLPTIC
eukprot:10516529-Alexandrium_andersonii.AAC.1